MRIIIVLITGLVLFSASISLRWQALKLSIYQKHDGGYDLNPDREQAYAAISNYIAALGVVFSALAAREYLSNERKKKWNIVFLH